MTPFLRQLALSAALAIYGVSIAALAQGHHTLLVFVVMGFSSSTIAGIVLHR